MPSSDHDTEHTSDLKKAVALRAVCICGFFSLGHLQMIALSVPLWGGTCWLCGGHYGCGNGVPFAVAVGLFHSYRFVDGWVGRAPSAQGCSAARGDPATDAPLAAIHGRIGCLADSSGIYFCHVLAGVRRLPSGNLRATTGGTRRGFPYLRSRFDGRARAVRVGMGNIWGQSRGSVCSAYGVPAPYWRFQTCVPCADLTPPGHRRHAAIAALSCPIRRPTPLQCGLCSRQPGHIWLSSACCA